MSSCTFAREIGRVLLRRTDTHTFRRIAQEGAMKSSLSTSTPLCVARDDFGRARHLRTRVITRAAWIVGFLVIGPGACSSGPKGPCYGLSVGSKFTITIGTASSVGTVQCGYSVDVTENEVIQATIAETSASSDSACTVGLAQFAPASINGWTWADGIPWDNRGQTYVIAGEYSATHAGCQGTVRLQLQAPSDPFQKTEGGTPSGAVLNRFFQSAAPGTATCPSSCADDYSVTLTRQ